MRKKIKDLFKVLQDADKAVAFSTYKTTNTYEDDDQPPLIAAKDVIDDPESIPESITAMSKYFFGARPNSKGGQIWTQVRILHNQEIDNIIADTMEDFKENKARLSKQMIQHWDVAQLGFLKHVSPDIDVDPSKQITEEQSEAWITHQNAMGWREKDNGTENNYPIQRQNTGRPCRM